MAPTRGKRRVWAWWRPRSGTTLTRRYNWKTRQGSRARKSGEAESVGVLGVGGEPRRRGSAGFLMLRQSRGRTLPTAEKKPRRFRRGSCPRGRRLRAGPVLGDPLANPGVGQVGELGDDEEIIATE